LPVDELTYDDFSLLLAEEAFAFVLDFPFLEEAGFFAVLPFFTVVFLVVAILFLRKIY
jgi:hypothetical protein